MFALLMGFTLSVQMNTRCPACGAEVPAGDFVCSKCNAPIRIMPPEPPPRLTFRGRVFKLLDRLNLALVILAVLSPFLVIGIPFVWQRLNDAQRSVLTVTNAWTRPIMVENVAETEMEGMEGMDMPSPEGVTTSIYLTIQNDGGADRLTSAATDIATTVTLHQTQIDERQIGRMVAFPEGFEIAPNSTLDIAPGGYHLMAEGLRQDLRLGEEFPLTLSFASGDEITVSVTVSDFPPTGLSE